ncbi:MAG: hypothetical protein GF375_04910 [Candidatus Omnitrophica bacterium]|nr:hypothetical protein [Candidatus Omnitrophota bacterium]
MPEVSLLLFTGPDCPKCEKVIAELVSAGIFHEDQAEELSIRPQIIRGEGSLTIFCSGTVDGLAAGAFHDVYSVPTLIIMKEGLILKRIVGDNMEITDTLKKWADKKKFF